MESRHSPPEYNWWKEGIFFPNILGMLNNSKPKTECSGSTTRRLFIDCTGEVTERWILFFYFF